MQISGNVNIFQIPIIHNSGWGITLVSTAQSHSRKKGVLPRLEGEVFSESNSEDDEEEMMQEAVRDIVAKADVQTMILESWKAQSP